MNLIQQIIIQSLIALFAAMASVIGTKLASMIWDRWACNEIVQKEKQLST